MASQFFACTALVTRSVQALPYYTMGFRHGINLRAVYTSGGRHEGFTHCEHIGITTPGKLYLRYVEVGAHVMRHSGRKRAEFL